MVLVVGENIGFKCSFRTCYIAFLRYWYMPYLIFRNCFLQWSNIIKIRKKTYDTKLHWKLPDFTQSLPIVKKTLVIAIFLKPRSIETCFNLLRMLFNQGISSQIRIVVKFNVMSEICFKNKKIFMKRSIIEITKDIFLLYYGTKFKHS